MLRSLNGLKGYSLDATDGEMGRVEDLFFDGAEWIVRYLVADTGDWLPGRLVLLSPLALGKPDAAAKTVPVELTRAQIENAPGIPADAPVSRQQERGLVEHFGWPVYWAPGGMAVGSMMNASQKPVEPIQQWNPPSGAEPEGPQLDPHLRSMREVSGYRIAARDGEIGHVEEFVIDDTNWAVRYVVADTRNWLPGRKVLLAPDWLEEIDWAARHARTAHTTVEIEESPVYDPSQPINRDYEGRLFDYYGRHGYWTDQGDAGAP